MPSAATPSTSSSSTNVGAIAGGVIGGLAGVGAVCFILCGALAGKAPSGKLEPVGRAASDPAVEIVTQTPGSGPTAWSSAHGTENAPFHPAASHRGSQGDEGASGRPLTDAERQQIAEAARRETAVDKGASKLFEAPYELKTGKPVEAARGLVSRMSVVSSDYFQLISKETDGILEEVSRFASGSNDPAVQEVKELLHYILYERASEKEYPNGIRDKGRPAVDLVYFITHSKAQRAGLKQPEVVALRLYTTAAYR